MAVLTAPMTASTYAQVVSASSNVRNTLNLAIQPPSGGMPVSDARNSVIITASPGAYWMRPPNELISPLCVLRETAMTTANAPRFVNGVDEQVDDDGLQRRVAGVPGVDVRQRHQDEPALADARVGEHAHDVRLAQGEHVADGHRQRREHPHERPVDVVERGEREEDHEHEGDEAGRLRRDGQERGHRQRRALVGVGRPRVERHGRHLEPEAGDDEHDGHDRQPVELPVGEDRARCR